MKSFLALAFVLVAASMTLAAPRQYKCEGGYCRPVFQEAPATVARQPAVLPAPVRCPCEKLTKCYGYCNPCKCSQGSYSAPVKQRKLFRRRQCCN